jgi:phage-related protein
MAIAPTGAMYKSLIFDGEDSRDYGVYITGQAVYNAPERDVEMISIPGRNGSFALDKGRFQNIEVTYPAGIFADTETDFAEAISGFRNFLCSRKGYVRLTDEYNPNEFRMAVYKSGLEVEPTQLKAGEFNLVFDCNPQRFLISGEDTIEIVSGQTITNPTRFESSPMLEVEGYGTIGFNNHEITINDVVIGEIETSTRSSQNIDKMTQASVSKTYQRVIDYSSHSGALENGDSLFVSSLKITAKSLYLGTGLTPVPTVSGDISTTTASGAVRNYSQVQSGATWNYADFTTSISVGSTELTAFTDESYSETVTSVLKYNDNNTCGTLTIVISIVNTASGTLTLRVTCNGQNQALGDIYEGGTIEYGRTYLYSTQSILGSPLYVDCDLGVAYKYEGGTIVSIDQHVDLGSNLPTLGPGENAIAYDVTVTDLKITPRWWKI